MTELNTAEYLEELAQTLASHGSNLAALRMAELEQKVSPYLVAPGVPSAQAGGGGSLAGVNTAYAPTVAMGAAGLFITNGAITVTNPGSTVIIDGTSDMFKIVATGTLDGAFPNATHTDSVTYTTLTGLGTYASIPAMHILTYDVNWMVAGNYHQFYTTDTGHLSWSIWAETHLVSSYVRVTLHSQCGAYNIYPQATAARYYVLKEAGF